MHLQFSSYRKYFKFFVEALRIIKVHSVKILKKKKFYAQHTGSERVKKINLSI